VNARAFPPPKAALDAMTDQALAHIRDHRDVSPGLVGAAAEVAAVIAEQFRDDPVAAGRAVMCASQMMSGIVVRLQDMQAADDLIGPMVADIFAYAAEQVVREAVAAMSHQCPGPGPEVTL
jgi:hypothetical protein